MSHPPLEVFHTWVVVLLRTFVISLCNRQLVTHKASPFLHSPLFGSVGWWYYGVVLQNATLSWRSSTCSKCSSIRLANMSRYGHPSAGYWHRLPMQAEFHWWRIVQIQPGSKMWLMNCNPRKGHQSKPIWPIISFVVGLSAVLFSPRQDLHFSKLTSHYNIF